MKRTTIIIISILLNISVQAQFNKVGRTALQFLKIGNGARQVAQGEAGIANANDINAVFWNPAATTGIDLAEASFNYTSWIADLKVLSGAVGMNFEGIGVFSFSFIKLGYGDLDEALVTSSTGGLDTRTGNTFTGGDLALAFSYARYFTDKLSIGISAKYLEEELYNFSTSLWAFDVGSYYETGWKGIRLGMSAQNFSSQARWMHTLEEAQQSYEIPIMYRIGASMDVMGGENLLLGGDPEMHKLTFSLDAIHSNDYGERMHFGAEYYFMNRFALRGGYKLNYDEGNLSFGIGVQQELSGISFQFDYAYVKYDYLESPHRFTITLAY
ncbi:MAG: PorV/PorQ family protein [Melioribacteraceae bacterium]|nr:PorV/PorQ family protein [Melioribacteraceae bacterium]MCF8355468.1 PorV/PorQ family protein [Melioribacteraceae bacterium]MCF8392555.1 PorV/PorQ family protein [Melioribacteraceae bacterium]MCF8418430.1 PorV/PorQ family protein [Melioribacteraceae bacterium]